MRGTCDICGDPVTNTQRAAFPVTGWELERGAGGANQITGRKRIPGRIAHASCVRQQVWAEQRGLRDQTQMFEN
jgi:hypothetical protein